jgi:hypothetical protein
MRESIRPSWRMVVKVSGGWPRSGQEVVKKWRRSGTYDHDHYHYRCWPVPKTTSWPPTRDVRHTLPHLSAQHQALYHFASSLGIKVLLLREQEVIRSLLAIVTYAYMHACM